jgi:hypothetical protein
MSGAPTGGFELGSCHQVAPILSLTCFRCFCLWHSSDPEKYLLTHLDQRGTRRRRAEFGHKNFKPPMKLRHLEYFVAAAEELNFTHAADRLCVSQPPFSKQLHDLEAEIALTCFRESTRELR